MNAIILALFSVCKAVVSASEFEFATEVPSSSSAAANYNITKTDDFLLQQKPHLPADELPCFTVGQLTIENITYITTFIFMKMIGLTFSASHRRAPVIQLYLTQVIWNLHLVPRTSRFWPPAK